MKIRLSTFFFILLLVKGFSQNDNRLAQGLQTLSSVEKISLPALDNDVLLQKEMERRQPGLPPKFAESFEVNITPTTHGNWETDSNGNLVWRLVIHSKNAKSLNLGFTNYHMPEGGSLLLYSTDYQHIIGPFTPSDNEEHEQLWTPVLPGDKLVIEVQIPENAKPELNLELKYINHDFLGFGAIATGNCNIDVICGALEGWAQIDDYRDIIRSVAVIGTGGNTFCSGFLVNNVRNDCTPFFITAKHCGIINANAPTLVAYWNYENSYCREVGSDANGNNGDGSLGDFNTGAIYRASSSTSDFALLELDDPVSETANAFFAGWSNLPVAPTNAVGIHHPGGEEKRICFENDELMLTHGLDPNPDANFTHVRVIDWDHGTTEIGSSGSPLFDQNKRVVGQLHGGAAACGNDKSDWYGSFSVSWHGDGTSSTMLKNWLDPDNTGTTVLDGRKISACNIFVECDPTSTEVCAPSNSSFKVFASETFESEVTLSVTTNIPGIEFPYFDDNTIEPGDSTQLHLTIDPFVATGNYTIHVTGTDGISTTSEFIEVHVFKTVPNSLELFTPINEETSTSIIPRFRWQKDSFETIYEIQIASDNDFQNIVASVESLDTTFYDNAALDVLTQYFWRVRGVNFCGDGLWSEAYSFTTADIHCLVSSSIDVPIILPEEEPATSVSTIEVPENGVITDIEVNNLDIHHTWVGDLVITIESPSGKIITLMDQPGVPSSNFGCPEDNLFLNFDEEASEAYDILDNTCNEGNLAISGTFQPNESLKILNGEKAKGTWKLAVIDMAEGDGGSLNGWDLNICSTIIPDLSINSSMGSPMFCVGEDIVFSILLGTGFDSTGINLSTVGSPPGSSVNFSANDLLPGESVELAIQGLNTIGNHSIFIVADDGNNVVTSEIVIQILDIPHDFLLMYPLNGQAGLPLSPMFSWLESNHTTDYTIEIATDELFENIVVSNQTIHSEFNLAELNSNTTYFWRVIATNECGEKISPVFIFTTDLIDDVENLEKTELFIYPNPTDGKVQFQFPKTFQNEVIIECFSSKGKLVGRISTAAFANSAEIDMRRLPDGIYLLRVTNQDIVFTKKIVLQK